MTHACEWHDSFTWVTWLTCLCAMTPPHRRLWQHLTCVTWLMHVCDMTHSGRHTDACGSISRTWWMYSHPLCCRSVRLWHDSFMCVLFIFAFERALHTLERALYTLEGALHTLKTKQNILDKMSVFASFVLQMCVCVCDVTHSRVWHDAFICVAWLIHVWHDSFVCVIRTSFIRVAWLIHVRDMTHPQTKWMYLPPLCWRTGCVWHDAFMCVVWLIHVWHDSFVRVKSFIHMFDVTHSCAWHDSSTDKMNVFASFVLKVCACVTWLVHVRGVTHSRVTWLIRTCEISHSCVWRDSFMCVTWLIHGQNECICLLCAVGLCMCDMTRSCVWYDFSYVVTWLNVRGGHDWLMYVTWLIDVCDMGLWQGRGLQILCAAGLCVWHDSFMCVAWLIHVCGMTHSLVKTWLMQKCDMTCWRTRHDSYLRDTWLIDLVTWLVHKCDMTDWPMWHDSFISVTWLINVRDMTCTYVTHDWLMYVTRLMRKCDMTDWPMWHDSCVSATCLTHQCDMTDWLSNMTRA